MRITILCVFFLLAGQGASVGAATDSGHGKGSGKPPAYSSVADMEGVVFVRDHGDTVRLRLTNAALEDVLQEIAILQATTITFHCADSTNQRKRISGGSQGKNLVSALTELFRGEYTVIEEKDGGEAMEEANLIRLLPPGCAETGTPVRRFVSTEDHPLRGNPGVELEELAAVIHTEGPESRFLALELLKRQGGQAARALAHESLADQNPRLAVAAAKTLGFLSRNEGKAEAVEAIWRLLQERRYLELVIVMTSLDKEKTWLAVNELCQIPLEKTQETAARALAATKDERGIPCLARLAREANPPVPRQAIFTIGVIGGAKATAALVALIKDPNPALQGLAAYALSFVSEEDRNQTRPVLVETVLGTNVSDELIMGLVEGKHESVLSASLTDPQASNDLKRRILSTIEERGSEDLVEAAATMLDDPSPSMRLAAIAAVAASYANTALPHVVKAVGDSDLNVRLAALDMLAEFSFSGEAYEDENKLVLETLAQVLNDGEARIRRLAIDLFYQLGQPDEAIAAELEKAAAHADPYVASRAAELIAFWEDYAERLREVGADKQRN